MRVRSLTIVMLMALLIGLGAVAYAGTIDNSSGKHDGTYIAEVEDSQTKEVQKDIEAELEGNFVILHFSKDNVQTLRSSELFNRRYEIEATCYDFKTKRTLIIRLREPGRDKH